MPTITLNLSASDLTRAVDALSTRWGYQPLINGSPNPQTKGEFVRLQIAAWIRLQVRGHELNTAQAAVVVADIDVS